MKLLGPHIEDENIVYRLSDSVRIWAREQKFLKAYRFYLWHSNISSSLIFFSGEKSKIPPRLPIPIAFQSRTYEMEQYVGHKLNTFIFAKRWWLAHYSVSQKSSPLPKTLCNIFT